MSSDLSLSVGYRQHLHHNCIQPTRFEPPGHNPALQPTPLTRRG